MAVGNGRLDGKVAIVTGWAIGNSVLYRVSEQARWITGIVLPVDAGTSAAPSAACNATVP